MLPGSFPNQSRIFRASPLQSSLSSEAVPSNSQPHRHAIQNATIAAMASESSEKMYIQKMLTKRKKSFHNDLNVNLGSLLLAFAFLEFLKDLSLTKLAFRAFVQAALFSSFDPAVRNFPNLSEIRKSSVLLAIICNIYCVVHTIVVDLPEQNTGGYSIGYWTLQFIGEKVPAHKWQLLGYDLVIFAIMVITFAAKDSYRLKYPTGSRASPEEASPLSGLAASGGTNDTNMENIAEEAGLEDNIAGLVNEETSLIARENEFDGLQGYTIVATLSIKELFHNLQTSLQQLES